MVKFTRALDEVLVDLVKENRILFDANDDHFKNIILKHKRWEDISAAMNIPVSECKKRWKSLRDQYNKKKKGESTGGERIISSWMPYMNMLSFLSDAMDRRDPDTNCKQTEEQHHEWRRADIKIEMENNEDQGHDSRVVDTESQNNSLMTETTVKKARRVKRKFHPMPKRFAQRTAIYRKPKENKTPIQKFFESMADTVDKLPPHLQAEVRLKVCQIVTETELNHYVQHATQSEHQSQLSNTEFTNTIPHSSNTMHSPMGSDELN